jgi:hypothetical protein
MANNLPFKALPGSRVALALNGADRFAADPLSYARHRKGLSASEGRFARLHNRVRSKVELAIRAWKLRKLDLSFSVLQADLESFPNIHGQLPGLVL